MIPDNANMVEYAWKVYFSGVTGSMYNKQTFGEITGAKCNEFMGKTSSYYRISKLLSHLLLNSPYTACLTK